jgi:hypothetical protein
MFGTEQHLGTASRSSSKTSWATSRTIWALFLAVVIGAPLSWADGVAVVGVGTSGTWTSELEIVNPSPTPLRVQVGGLAEFEPLLCPGTCAITHVDIPGSGSMRLGVADIPNLRNRQDLNTVYVVAEIPDVVPVVRARVFNTEKPQQAIEVPAVRLSTLTAHSIYKLHFPSVTRNTDVHTNLIIARPVGGLPPIRVRVEAFDGNGARLAEAVFTGLPEPGGNYYPNVFLIDVLAQLGLVEVPTGSLRVTSLDGGEIWGFTSRVFPAGNVSTVIGWNP